MVIKKQDNFNIRYDDWIDTSTYQNKLNFKISFLKDIKILNDAEVKKLRNNNIDFLEVGIKNHKYPRKKVGGITYAVYKVVLFNEQNELSISGKKEWNIKIPFKKMVDDESLRLFHIYAEAIISPRSEILRFFDEPYFSENFLKVKPSEANVNLILVLSKFKIINLIFSNNIGWQHTVLVNKLKEIVLSNSDNKDLFFPKVEYYKNYLKTEKDLIKKFILAKEVLKKETNDIVSLNIILDYYTSIDETTKEEFKDFFLRNFDNFKKDGGFSDFKTKSFKYFLKTKDFELCEKIVADDQVMNTGWVQNKEVNEYLKATLEYHKGNYLESITILKSTIGLIDDDEQVLACYIYLLLNYIKLNDEKGFGTAFSFISRFIEDGVDMYDFFIFQYNIPDRDYFLRVLKKESDKRKNLNIKVLELFLYLKYIIILSKDKEFNWYYDFSKDNENEILGYIKSIKESHIISNFTYFLLAKLFDLLKDYNNATKYKIRYIFTGGKEYIQDFDLSLCSNSFKNNYFKILKDLIRKERKYGLHTAEEDMLLNYSNEQFDSDMPILWSEKKYDVISNIYVEFEDYLDSQYNNPFSDLSVDYRFEIAYSLKESGYDEKAKNVYESIDKKSSSVLNNLAMIYEKEGNFEKAKDLIKSVYKMASEDEIIERNYNRLFSKKDSKDNGEDDFFEVEDFESLKQEEKKDIIFEMSYDDEAELYYISVNQYEPIEVRKKEDWEFLYDLIDYKEDDFPHKNFITNKHKDEIPLQKDVLMKIFKSQKPVKFLKRNGKKVIFTDNVRAKQISLGKIKRYKKQLSKS